MPKSSKKGSKKAKTEANICDDKNFDEELRIVYIEYSSECPVFKEKAHACFKRITEAFPLMKFKLFENLPRNGSFEVKVARNCRLPTKEVWSGIEKEPRDEKFPHDMEKLLKIVENILK